MELCLTGVELATIDGLPLIEPTTVTFPHGITALVGSNGAGKSTLLRAIVGLHPLTAGTIRLGAIDHRRDRTAFLAQSVFVPQNFTGYPEMTGEEFLTYFLRLRGVRRGDATRRAQEWLAAVGMEQAGRRKTATYSQGMLQRLGFAYAMQSNAELCVMDEPFAGIDPEGRDALTALLFRASSTCVTLLSTHHLEDVQTRGGAIARIAAHSLVLHRALAS